MGRPLHVGVAAIGLMAAGCAHAPRAPGEALGEFGAALARGDCVALMP